LFCFCLFYFLCVYFSVFLFYFCSFFRIVQSLDLCTIFSRSLFVFAFLSFCVWSLHSLSIYGFWLPLWYIRFTASSFQLFFRRGRKINKQINTTLWEQFQNQISK
jgi:hypothetical protein